jgi:aryl-alcohol dehydrogenase-like predicted oxidoreductase
MQFTKFGATGLTVSRMILGTGTFGKQTDEKEAHRMLDKAAEAGINIIDTADVYPPGAEAGGAEIITGRWLTNKRAGFILATKGGGKMGPAAWDAGSSRKHLLDAIDASLRRLNTDCVDIYQLHMDDPVTPIDEMVGAMDTILRSGRARDIGVSNILAYRLAKSGPDRLPGDSQGKRLRDASLQSAAMDRCRLGDPHHSSRNCDDREQGRRNPLRRTPQRNAQGHVP